MFPFSKKTLVGKYLRIHLSLANWYEDRLAVDQLYQRKPDLKIVKH